LLTFRPGAAVNPLAEVAAGDPLRAGLHLPERTDEESSDNPGGPDCQKARHGHDDQHLAGRPIAARATQDR